MKHPTVIVTATVAGAVLAAVLAVTQASAGGSTPAGAGGRSPAKLLHLDRSDWKITLPIGTKNGPTDVLQPDLDTFSIKPFFTVVGNSVQFQAPVTGMTTPNSSYPRSELRENINWDNKVGKNTMTIDEAITATPAVKPHVVAGQIHDAGDDVLVIRLEGSKLFVDHNGDDGPTLSDSYVLGTRFTVNLVASDGQIKVFYNGRQVDDYTVPATSEGLDYFKAGAYTQANCTNSAPCDNTNFGQVNIYRLKTTHSPS